jgi:hypothetical protein
VCMERTCRQHPGVAWLAMADFEIISLITDVQTIARGRGIREVARLNRLHGRTRGRKLEGRPRYGCPRDMSAGRSSTGTKAMGSRGRSHSLTFRRDRTGRKTQRTRLTPLAPAPVPVPDQGPLRPSYGRDQHCRRPWSHGRSGPSASFPFGHGHGHGRYGHGHGRCRLGQDRDKPPSPGGPRKSALVKHVWDGSGVLP